MESSPPQCLVVMYRYVHDGDPVTGSEATVPNSGIRGLRLSEFRDQLDHLCAAAEPIDWPALVAGLVGRGALPERSFLLTFDDGLADHAKNVLPILEERGLRGVFFIPTAVLAGRGMIAAHQVHLLFSVLGETALEGEIERALEGAKERGWAKRLRGEATAGAEAARAMYPYETPLVARLKHLLMMDLPRPLREQVLDDLFARHVGSVARWAKHWYLTWDDVARMEKLGHTIGGHGHLHEPYARLNADEVHQDVVRAAAILSEGLGPDPRPFSFPYGSHTDAACGACREAGFVHAFTTQPRWVSQGCDPHRLPRVDTILLEGQPLEGAVCQTTR